MTDLFGQQGYAVRLEWGVTGALAARADVAVVVDVLSFSTAVTIAVERGMKVYPCREVGSRAEAFAAERDAALAVGRARTTTDGGGPVVPSLSPAGMLACTPAERLVLPSPNGAAVATALKEAGGDVAVGCLRNGAAVARWLAWALVNDRSVVVVAAGERWAQDGSLRPSLEDQLGAGAILSGVVARGFGERMSPEARAAADLFDVARSTLHERLLDSVSGRELVSRGFREDVNVAAEVDASVVVPVMNDGAFVPGGTLG